MRWHAALLGLVVGTTTASCAFLLDFGELQKEQGTATADAGGAGGSEAGAQVPLKELAAQYAQALCKRVDRCYGALAMAALGDEDCVENFEKRIGQSVFKGLEALSPDRFQYHPELAPACLVALENAPCDVLFPIPEECDAAIEGKVAGGGECTHSGECGRGFYCDATPTSCPGTCQPKPKAGEPCEDRGCLEGLQCEPIVDLAAPGGVKLVCLAPVGAALGECEGGKFASCRIDMTCLGKEAGVSGKCYSIADLFTVGKALPCNWQKGPLCGPGLHCALTQPPPNYAGVCVEPALSGTACKAALPDTCPAREHCNLTLGLNGICESLPEDQQPCVLVPLKALCKKGNRCIGRDEDAQPFKPGTCTGIAGLTDSCSADELCYSGYCTEGSCAPPNFCTK